MDLDRQFLIILSGRAGRGEASSLSLGEEIRESFKKAGLAGNCEILLTQHEHHLSEAAGQFAREHNGNAVIYVAGGDGSLNEVVTSINGTQAAFGVIPAGTANDFARTIYGRKMPEIRKIINAMPYPEFKRMDLIKVVFPGDVCLYSQQGDPKKLTLSCPEPNRADGSFEVLSLNVLSFGFDTLVLRRAYELMKKWPKLGANAYYLSVLNNLGSKKSFPMDYRLELTDGNIISGQKDYVTAALCNGGFYGNGFNPAPMADPFDNVLDLCGVSWMGPLRFVPMILRYLKGRHVGSEYFSIYKTVAGSFSTCGENQIMGNYDGLIFSTKSFSFEILPHALNFATLQI